VKRRGGAERYTVNEIDEMLARGENRTDWVAVKATSELEGSIAADPEDIHEPIDWSRAVKACHRGSATFTSASTRMSSSGSASRPRAPDPDQ
jgi:hypothetical protein